MRVPDTRQLVEQACEFPVEHETVAARLGDVRLDCPTGETVRMAAVLDRTDSTTYRSAHEVYTTVMGNLDEAFVGRKYYDDRAGVRGEASERRTRPRSF